MSILHRRTAVPRIAAASLAMAFYSFGALPDLAAGTTSPATSRSRRQVAITFDDLPFTRGTATRSEKVMADLVKSITASGVPAIGFVNEGKLHVEGSVAPERVRLLRSWLDAGLDLGNHSFSHVSIDRVSLAEYEKDVIKGEVITRRLLDERGRRPRYFRHPQLRTGPTVAYQKGLASFLRRRRYEVAPVTIDNNDYIFAEVYSRAKERGDQAMMKQIVDAYVPYMETIFDFFEHLSEDSLGYEVRQTLLLHANDLNADHFGDLVAMMRRRGYEFISLEEALKDPAYRLPEGRQREGCRGCIAGCWRGESP